MRAIILYGQPTFAQAAYFQIDAMLRDLQVANIVLAQTRAIEPAQAAQLQAEGSQLWFCGPDAREAGHPHRFLMASTRAGIEQQAKAALEQYLALAVTA